jgi:gamma-glutamyltranspeptidase / glutathione hydrolase
MIRSQLIASRTEVIAERGVATGGHPLEAEAGVRMLQQGGNAVDAVVAAAFTGFVVEPASCGLGGYGRMAVFVAERGEFVTIDHYVRAPLAARPDMFELDTSTPPRYYGHPRTVGRRAEWGHQAVAVPGAVAGLCAAHEMLGKLPLAQVLEPAIEAAEAGLTVTWDLALVILEHAAEISHLPHTAAMLMPGGQPPRAMSAWHPGAKLDCTALARTLRRIAQHGAAGFYSGPVAEAIQRELTSHGGILTAADLAAYRPKILRESPATYRGRPYVTAYDQVSYQALNILDHFELAEHGPDSPVFRHLAAEAIGHAFADNMTHYGDPDHTLSPVNGLASRAFAAARARGIQPDRAAARPITAADPWPYESQSEAPQVLPQAASLAGLAGTGQMAAADRAGNLATLITSLTGGFGSLVLEPETGVFLNNAMQNFDPRPGFANDIRPGKMPIFAAPALAMAEAGRALFGACGSGGYRILTGVLHSLVNALDFGMSLQAAVDAPRVHCQGQETYVDSRIPAAVQERLREMGHTVVAQAEELGMTTFARVNAVRIDPRTGLLHAATGPAWSTAAAGYS